MPDMATRLEKSLLEGSRSKENTIRKLRGKHQPIPVNLIHEPTIAIPFQCLTESKAIPNRSWSIETFWRFSSIPPQRTGPGIVMSPNCHLEATEEHIHDFRLLPRGLLRGTVSSDQFETSSKLIHILPEIVEKGCTANCPYIMWHRAGFGQRWVTDWIR